MERKRLGISLLMTLCGTILSLPYSKRYHAGLGFCFSLLAILHVWQYRRRLRYEMTKERQAVNIFSRLIKLNNPEQRAIFFLRYVQILHYIPGRVRLYSEQLVKNDEAAALVRRHLDGIPEIIRYALNPVTGSLLIEYSPEKASQNPFLNEVEQMIQRQYGRS